MELIISIISSLIASLIWIFFTILFDFYAKKKIDILLELALDSSNLFENSIRCKDYPIALQQADNLMKNILDISNAMKYFTYRFQKGKRKFFITILYNAIYNLSIFKNLSIGYDGVTEYRARCQRYERKYMYNIEVGNFNETFLTFSLELLQYTNNARNLKIGLNERLKMFSGAEKRMIMEKLVSRRIFNSKESLQHYIRRSTFYEKQYLKLIKKCFK